LSPAPWASTSARPRKCTARSAGEPVASCLHRCSFIGGTLVWPSASVQPCPPPVTARHRPSPPVTCRSVRSVHKPDLTREDIAAKRSNADRSGSAICHVRSTLSSPPFLFFSTSCFVHVLHAAQMNAAFGIVPLMVLIGLLNLLGAGISQWAVPDALVRVRVRYRCLWWVKFRRGRARLGKRVVDGAGLRQKADDERVVDGEGRYDCRCGVEWRWPRYGLEFCPRPITGCIHEAKSAAEPCGVDSSTEDQPTTFPCAVSIFLNAARV